LLRIHGDQFDAGAGDESVKITQSFGAISRLDDDRALNKTRDGYSSRVGCLDCLKENAALGFPLHSVLRLDRWRRPDEIGWVSESGLIKQRGSFTFTEMSAGGTRIVLRIEYTPPASLLGAAVAGRLDGFVRRRLAAAMERIRDRLQP